MSHDRDEVQAAVDRYCELRDAIANGDETWTALADLFTHDAVYIDPAWGRIEGVVEIRQFLEESMLGLEDWDFPIEFTAIEGDDVIIKWTQQLPGTREDGRRFEQSGFSRLVYAGDGKFRYEEDILNMAHVMEDLTRSGWQPKDGFTMPPQVPERDFRLPNSR